RSYGSAALRVADAGKIDSAGTLFPGAKQLRKGRLRERIASRMPAATLPRRKGLTGKLTVVLSASQLGLLLSAFFWTYACLQPVTGWLVDRVNVNWVIAGGFCLWSCATAATGMVHAIAALFVF